MGGTPGRSATTIALATLLSCLFFACGEQRSGTAGAGDAIYGIHEPVSWLLRPDLASPAQVAEMIDAAEAESHRWLLSWSSVERRPPRHGRHSYDFAPYDAMYEADLARGIRPLIFLVDAPPWAWLPSLRHLDIGYGIPPAAEHLGDWAEFTAAVATRYPDAAAIEIWNEPNLVAFWGRGIAAVRPDPAFYTRMLGVAYRAIKTVNPDMAVLGGAIGVATGNSSLGTISTSNFATAIFRAGASQYMDGVSVHAYPTLAAPLDRRLFEPMVEAARAARRDLGTPIWITELGATTTGDGFHATPPQQAEIYLDVLDWVAAEPDIAAVYFHSLTDVFHAAPDDPERGLALTRGGAYPFEPVPAYRALAAASGEQD